MAIQTTHARVHELFDYDAATGVLTNKVRRARAAPGQAAGFLRKDGYLTVAVDGTHYLVHRIIWLWGAGEWPTEQIDHIDSDRANNRWANLREASPQQNNINKRISRANSSGVKGAVFHPQSGKWRARVQRSGKQVQIGMFETPELAGAAYLVAAKTIQGAFARGSA